MTPNAAAAQNPFQNLMAHQNGSNIQDFMNPIHDAVFKFKNITDEDKRELKDLLNIVSGDHLFNEFVCKFFVNGMTCYGIKSSIQNISEFPNIAFISALRILNDVFGRTENTLIRAYLIFLTFDVEAFIQYSTKQWDEVQMHNDLFHHFIEDYALPKYLKHNHSIEVSNKHGYCLLSFFCQKDEECRAVIPALLKHANVTIDWEQCKNLNAVFAQLVNNYEHLNSAAPTAGFDVNGSFENAVKLFTFVAPNWDNLSATFTLRNAPLPSVSSSSLMGGSRISDSDVVRIFAGDYNLVPTSEPKANQTSLDVIADFNVYNQLPQARKLQVAHFLLGNRKRFNDVLGEAAQLIINGLQTKLNASSVSQAFASKQFAPSYARNVGFGSNDSALNEDARSFISKLSKQYESTNIRTFDQAIGFIVHNYLPMLRQFQNRCNEKYGLANARASLAQFSTDRVLNVVGVCSVIPSITSSMTGGKRVTPVRAEPETVPTVVEQPTVSAAVEPSTEELPASEEEIKNEMLIEGGTSTDDLVNAYIEGQKAFNKSYEDLYRKLVSALNSVNISSVQAQTFTKLYGVCNQFESIAIKSAKTTSYLSGFYGAKNYNRLYTKAIENTIRSIEEAHVSSFDGCVAVLKQIKALMTSTAQKVQELRNKYINSPKSVSEMLIVVAKKIKHPCKLTQRDFNNFTEAVNRIYNVIRNYTSETSTYNTKQQLDAYIGKLESREKVINEHYENLRTALRSKMSSYVQPDNRERQYAKEAQERIYDQLEQAMLYLNKVFDVKLAKERMAHLHDVNLTPQQIDRIEKAFLAFRNFRITDEFKKRMLSLDDKLNPVSVGSVFKIVKKLRKLIVQSQYLQFIVQLYKELGIFAEDFDWQQFIQNYTQIVVLSSIRIQPTYEVGSDRLTIEGICHKLACAFEKLCVSEHPLIDNSFTPKNAGYTFMIDFLRRACTVKAPKGIFNTNIKAIQNLFGDARELDDLIAKNPEINNDAKLFAECNKLSPTKNEFTKAIFGCKATSSAADVKITKSANDTIIAQTAGAFDNGSLSNEAKVAILAVAALIKEYGDRTDKPKPYFFSRLPGMLCELVYGLKHQETEFGKLCTESLTRKQNWSVGVSDGTSEISIAEYAIDALFANILAVVDKYWSLKYSGVLQLPLNINTVLRGGALEGDAKVEGGSVFDSMPLHDQTYSTVITEAVPFYLCALHICQYYIQTFSVKKISDDNMELVLTINKVSALYPVYEIFHKYEAKIQTLTPQQLKVCLAVFNEYWNQTTGNEASRLSRAIDLLFNELNACFIFTDRLQYDIMKSTNSLSKTAVDVISTKIDYLVNTMKRRLAESVVEVKEDPQSQNKRLEGLLNHAFNEVKRSAESQRLATLKAMLCESDKGGELRDYYAFMELVISPLLICAKSYMHIFSLFDNYSFNADDKYQNSGSGVKLNLQEVFVYWRDLNSTKNGLIERLDSAWNIINAIKSNRRPELKVLFMENPVVVKYNRIALNKALDSMHQTGKFQMPNFWLVMDEHTYPRDPIIELKYQKDFAQSDTIPLLRQLYPTVEAKTVADYYNHSISEFISDYDHFIHAFLSYPGLSDKSIKLISKRAHDAFKIANTPAGGITYDRMNDEDRFSQANVYTFKPMGDNDQQNTILNAARPLSNIPVRKVEYFISPPALPNKTIIPRFPDLQSIEELEITLENRFGKQLNVQLDGCSVFIRSNSAASEQIEKCEYGWLDWVVFQIARCDKLNFCLPYRFLQMLQDYPGLNVNLRVPGFLKTQKGPVQQYNRNSSGVYANIVTQNIVARSATNANKDKADLAGLNPSWIAALVAMIPYLINTLTAHKNSMEPSVQYNNQSVNQQLTQLIDVLTAFYDEVSNHAPFLGFMTDLVAINAQKIKPHLFAELLALVNYSDLDAMDVSDFIKLEWANQYFFNYVDGIQFPEYKNRDRFEWIRQFAPEKVNNGTFKTEFDTTIQTLGRLAWASLIAKTHKLEVEFKNVYRELDSVIIKVMNIMSDVDLGITEQYIQNIIAEYTNFYQHGVDPSIALTGGDATFQAADMKGDARETIALIKRLSVGIFTGEPVVRSAADQQKWQQEMVNAFKSPARVAYNGTFRNPAAAPAAAAQPAAAQPIAQSQRPQAVPPVDGAQPIPAAASDDHIAPAAPQNPPAGQPVNFQPAARPAQPAAAQPEPQPAAPAAAQPEPQPVNPAAVPQGNLLGIAQGVQRGNIGQGAPDAFGAPAAAQPEPQPAAPAVVQPEVPAPQNAPSVSPEPAAPKPNALALVEVGSVLAAYLKDEANLNDVPYIWGLSDKPFVRNQANALFEYLGNQGLTDAAFKNKIEQSMGRVARFFNGFSDADIRTNNCGPRPALLEHLAANRSGIFGKIDTTIFRGQGGRPNRVQNGQFDPAEQPLVDVLNGLIAVRQVNISNIGGVPVNVQITPLDALKAGFTSLSGGRRTNYINLVKSYQTLAFAIVAATLFIIQKEQERVINKFREAGANGSKAEAFCLLALNLVASGFVAKGIEVNNSRIVFERDLARVNASSNNPETVRANIDALIKNHVSKLAAVCNNFVCVYDEIDERLGEKAQLPFLLSGLLIGNVPLPQLDQIPDSLNPGRFIGFEAAINRGIVRNDNTKSKDVYGMVIDAARIALTFSRLNYIYGGEMLFETAILKLNELNKICRPGVNIKTFDDYVVNFVGGARASLVYIKSRGNGAALFGSSDGRYQYLLPHASNPNAPFARNGNNLVITGGTNLPQAKVDVFIDMAGAIAYEAHNRAIYYDLSQNFNSVPLLVNVDNNGAPSLNYAAYHYKFLYNPNLCALFNKTRYSPLEFITYLLASEKYFVFNPFTPATNSSVDWNKVELRLNDQTVAMYGLSNEPHRPVFVRNLFDGTNYSFKVGEATIREHFNKLFLKTARISSGNFRQLSETEIEVSRENYNKAFINAGSGRDGDQRIKPVYKGCQNRRINFTPIANAASSRRPYTHNVTISDDMFLLAPANKLVCQYLFSPQKDIFNATIYEYNDICVPTLLNFAQLRPGIPGKPFKGVNDAPNLPFIYNFCNQLEVMQKVSNTAGNDNKVAADTADITTGSIFADAFKAVSDFQSFAFNPIYKFIQLLIEDNVSQVFGPDRQLQYNNFGFDIGNTDRINTIELTETLSGGYAINDNFSDSLVNLKSSMNGNKEIEMLQNAYNLDGSDPERSLCPSKILYSYLFKNGFSTADMGSNSTMFRLILNYFHKYNISFNSMFNQLCFPSILFNASALRLSIKRIKELMRSIIDSQPKSTEVIGKEDGYKARTFKFARAYLDAYVGESPDRKQDNLTLDLCKDYRYQIEVQGTGRVENDSDLAGILDRVQDTSYKLGSNNLALGFANQFAAPSVSNNFMVELQNYLAIETDPDKQIKGCVKNQQLFATGISSALRHLDSVSTYISVLFTLMKHTSYYSHEYERDMTFFNVESPEVFSVV